MNMSYIFSQDGSLCVMVGENYYTVSTGHINFLHIKKAVADKDVERFLSLLHIEKTIANKSDGLVTVVDGNVLYCGQVINDILTARMLELIRTGYDVGNFTRFLTELMQNTSHNSVHQLCAFLENKCLPFTDDGCFLAYKTVRSDYLDKHTGTISNKVGQKPNMARNLISDDPNNTCDVGLHVGALHYAGPNGWYHNKGEHIMIVKVNPKNVVCVPNDHSMGKMRTCEYEVVGEYKGDLNKPVYANGEALETAADVFAQLDDYDDDTLYDTLHEIEDIWEGDELTFVYNNKPRTLLVDRVQHSKDLVSGHTPDGYRAFKFDEMSDIRFANCR